MHSERRCGLLLPTSHVARSVCLSVSRPSALQKRLHRSRLLLDCIDWRGSKKPCIRWRHIFGRHLATTIERSVLGVDAGCRYLYSSNLFAFWCFRKRHEFSSQHYRYKQLQINQYKHPTLMDTRPIYHRVEHIAGRRAWSTFDDRRRL